MLLLFLLAGSRYDSAEEMNKLIVFLAAFKSMKYVHIFDAFKIDNTSAHNINPHGYGVKGVGASVRSHR